MRGRVYREYIGMGPAGAAAAEQDAKRRQRKKRIHDRNARLLDLGTRHAHVLAALDHLANAYAATVLKEGGYYLHRNAEWRRRRSARCVT